MRTSAHPVGSGETGILCHRSSNSWPIYTLGSGHEPDGAQGMSFETKLMLEPYSENWVLFGLFEKLGWLFLYSVTVAGSSINLKAVSCTYN